MHLRKQWEVVGLDAYVSLLCSQYWKTFAKNTGLEKFRTMER